MSSLLERYLAIIELLVESPNGLSISDIASTLDQSPSGVHRILSELTQLGYVRQTKNHGDYTLCIKRSSLGLMFLNQSGITDVAQPILDDLAHKTKELVRLSVIDQDKLVWVAVSQGASGGLRYDPDSEQGMTVQLDTTAGGLAWLSTMNDDDALSLLVQQRNDDKFQKNKISSLQDVLKKVQETRARGYSITKDTYIEGMSAMAAPIYHHDSDQVIGMLSVAGPAVRLCDDKIAEFAPILAKAAQQVGRSCEASNFFKNHFTSPKTYSKAG